MPAPPDFPDTGPYLPGHTQEGKGLSQNRPSVSNCEIGRSAG